MSSVVLGKRTVAQFLDIEAEASGSDEDEEEDEDEENRLDDFIVGADVEEEVDGEEMFPRTVIELDNEETAEEIAQRYDALASSERHRESRIEAYNHGGDGNTILEALRNVILSEDTHQSLWCFRVRVGSEKHHFEHVNRYRDALSLSATSPKLIEVAFAARHLPGRFFVLATQHGINKIRKDCGIRNFATPIPKAEWGVSGPSSLFLPWQFVKVPIRSWVRIHAPGIYRGDLAYVVGSSNKWDCLLLAIVPRINLSPKRARKKQSKKSSQKVKSRRTRVLPCLFDLEDVARCYGASSVTSYRLPEGGLREIFDGTIKQGAEGEQSATGTRKPTTAPSARAEYGATEVGQHLDVDNFEFLPILAPGWDTETQERHNRENAEEKIHYYDNKCYFRGLVLIPIYAHGVVEFSTTLPADEIIPFAESHIDQRSINAILSQLHWREGDLLQDNQTSFTYKLADVNILQNHLQGTLVSSTDDQLSVDHVYDLPLSQIERLFHIGDEVVILAGRHKGKYGHIVQIDLQSVSVLTNAQGEQEHVYVARNWLASHTLPFRQTHESHIVLGEFVRVVRGDRVGFSGFVAELFNQGYLLKVHSTNDVHDFLVASEAVEVIRDGHNPLLDLSSQILQAHPWQPDGHAENGDFVEVNSMFAHAWGFVQGTEDGHICVLRTEEVPGLSDNLPPLKPGTEDADILTAQETEDREAAQARAAAGLIYKVYPSNVIIYDRIKRYDTIRVNQGTLEGRTGLVLELWPDGYLIFLDGTSERLRVFRTFVNVIDRICAGDSVKPIAASALRREGAVKEVQESGILSVQPIDGNPYEIHITGVVKLVAQHYYSSGKHPAVGKRVQIVQGSSATIQRSFKGLVGDVVAHNGTLNNFVVNIPSVGKVTFEPEDLRYLIIRRDKEVLGDFLGGDSAELDPLTSEEADVEGVHRSTTPMPDNQEEEDSNEPWAVGPSAEPSSFLADDIWKKFDQSHIRVSFKPSYQRGSYLGRQAGTCLPFSCDNILERRHVKLYWSDNKGRKIKGDVLLQDVEPAIPKKKGLIVMIMNGDKRGVIAKVTQVKKAKNKAVLQDVGGTWESDMSDLCIVEEHTDTCDCFTF